MRTAFSLAAIFLASPAAGQTITTGTWTGTLQWSNADPVPLSAEIQTCAEGLKLNLASEDGRYQTANTVVAISGPMVFDIRNAARGYTLGCSQTHRDDGSLAGTCASGSSRARLSLKPPAQGEIGCSE